MCAPGFIPSLFASLLFGLEVRCMMSWHGEIDGKRFSAMIEIGRSFL
jgi:hypothetical protein